MEKLYIETYGCQMNLNDSEVVSSVLCSNGYTYTEVIEEASLIILNTCAVRDHAENRVLQRLHTIKKMKKNNPALLIGVIGCMAERIKDELFEMNLNVDIIAGPDSYKQLPSLVTIAKNNTNAIDVYLSETETYSDIAPQRIGHNRISAFISIMRGCNNFCSYCIVPYTRGRERSRDVASIMAETNILAENSYKEITLLGQNVNSYFAEEHTFPQLLERITINHPEIRIRFTTSHPKDLSNELVAVMAQYPNICKSIHLPFQSGSNAVLQKMNRKYTREWYLDRIAAIKQAMPDCSLSTDILSGFSGETDEDHRFTILLMNEIKFDMAFMFKYSVRPGTLAEKNYPDDVPEATKTERLNKIIALQNSHSLFRNKADIGKIFDVLVEGFSKKTDANVLGRTSQNKPVIFPSDTHKPGTYATVKITDCTSATLKGVLC